MTSTNIAAVMRRGVTRATAFLDPALALEAKLPQSLHANGAATRNTSWKVLRAEFPRDK